MRLFIDNQQADIDQDSHVSISLSIASMTQIESGRTGYSKSIRIPMTRRNMSIIGDTDQINAVAMYNQQIHTARLEVDGFTVIEGSPMLISCAKSQNSGWYDIAIIGAAKLWVKQAAEAMFKDIPIEFNEVITPIMVFQSWSWDKAVRFLPVQRDKELVDNDNNRLFAPARILSFEDYHPFISARALLKAIMNQAGYSIVSNFVESEYFGSFYMSGAYPTKNVDLIRSKMDFRAGKFATSSAVADRLGRVKADPSLTSNSVGNIVDTANPKELSSGTSGTPTVGVFCYNNCFQKIENFIVFVPVTEVILGFEYNLKYTTDYYILSRTELKGFNTIYLEDMVAHKYKIVNRFADRKDQVMPAYKYNIVVFDHKAGNQYQLRYDKLTGTPADPDNLKPTDYTTITHTTFSTRTQLFTISSDKPIIKTYLYVRPSGASTFTPYSEDWAIYDGYVNERDRIEVEVTIRSAPGRVLPSQPKYFNNIYFGGADQGMKITIDKSTTLRPIFVPHPAENTRVRFNDLAAHEMRQMEFINALKQLFNLYFYTDNINKQVFIEPRESFYSDSVVVDWSDRIDYSKPIDVQELGADVKRTITLLYQDGDGTVARWNESFQQKFGRWRTQIKNRFAKDGQTIYQNPVFRPSMNKNDVYPDAPDSLWLQVGDRDRYAISDTEELNFPPKIVRYLGMTPLPTGQIWGWPANSNRYPAVIFHYKGSQNRYQGDAPNPLSSHTADQQKLLQNGISLCFEDRDGVSGMHRFYDDTIDMYNNSRRVTIYLMLRPEDIEPLINPNGLMRDFRALYRLKIDGEYAMFRLEEVCDYNPAANGSTKCVFIKNT